MKYRLKSDPTKTIKTSPATDCLRGRPWVNVVFMDWRLHAFTFSVPVGFLEECGWEPEPEEDEGVLIEEKLELVAASMRTPGNKAACAEAAAEIRALRDVVRQAYREYPNDPRHRLDVDCEEFLCLPEKNPHHYCTPAEAYRLLAEAKEVIKNLRAQCDEAKEQDDSECRPSEADMMSRPLVREKLKVAELEGNLASLARKYEMVLHYNATLREDIDTLRKVLNEIHVSNIASVPGEPPDG